jgi:hypothetical protein
MLATFVLVYGVLAVVGLLVTSAIAGSVSGAGYATMCAFAVYMFQLFELKRHNDLDADDMYVVQYVLLVAVAATGAASFVYSVF